LIVEDRPVMRAMLREFVQDAFPDCAIMDAPNSARAEELCAKHKPKLVLMDVCLPDGNGIELSARLKAADSGCAVIVISYLTGQDYVDQAQAAGAFAYILKDRLVMELVPAISQVLGVQPAPGSLWR
jgi:DNA-binding NarL/FixJ family response regulator